MAVGRFRRGSSHVQRGVLLTCLAQRIMCEFDPKFIPSATVGTYMIYFEHERYHRFAHVN